MGRMDDGGRRRGWIRGAAFGCGLGAVIPMVAVLVVGARTCAPLESASRDRAELERRFGRPAAFTPAPDGAVPPDRLRRFLQVRRALAGTCTEFREVQRAMQRVEDMSDRDDASGEAIAGTAKGLAGVAVTLTPLVGEFFRVRNAALLEAQIGLGEYAYIYLLSYHERLSERPSPRGIFSPGGALPPEVGGMLLAILERWTDSLPEDARERRMLEGEVAALRADPTRVPFHGGAPPAAAASLDPYRQGLDAGFCSATAELEMERGARRALLDALY